MIAAVVYPETATLAVAGADEIVVMQATTVPAFLPDMIMSSRRTMKPKLAGLWRCTARLRLKNDAVPTVTEVQASLLDKNSNRVIEVTNVVTIVTGDRHTLQLSGIVNVKVPFEAYELWWLAIGGTPTIDGSQAAYAAVEWEYLG